MTTSNSYCNIEEIIFNEHNNCYYWIKAASLAESLVRPGKYTQRHLVCLCVLISNSAEVETLPLIFSGSLIYSLNTEVDVVDLSYPHPKLLILCQHFQIIIIIGQLVGEERHWTVFYPIMFYVRTSRWRILCVTLQDYCC